MQIFKRKLIGIGILLVFLTASVCYADRVCLEKTTGKLIEYQSDGKGQRDLDVMVQNAVNAGHREENVEAKFITREEWQAIKEEQIDRPEQEKARQRKEERKQKEEKVKQKLNLSKQDFQDLKEALSD